MTRSDITTLLLGIFLAVVVTRTSLNIWPLEQPTRDDVPRLPHPLFEKRYPITFDEYLRLYCETFLTIGEIGCGDYMFCMLVDGKEGVEVIIVAANKDDTGQTPFDIDKLNPTFKRRIAAFKGQAERWRMMGYDIPEDRIHITNDALTEYIRIREDGNN